MPNHEEKEVTAVLCRSENRSFDSFEKRQINQWKSIPDGTLGPSLYVVSITYELRCV
jgi:hypothetical protein